MISTFFILYNFNLIGEKSTILHVAIPLCIDYNVYWSIYQLKVRLVNIKVKKDNSNFVNFFLRWREDQGMA